MKLMEFIKLLDKKGINLTKQQQDAVTFFKGILLLLSVPGSGKTTSIISRNAYLMLVRGISAAQICNITFSKEAAIEMKKRFKKFFGKLEVPYFSTIHSLSYKIVKEYLISKKIPFTIIEGDIKDKKIMRSSLIKNIFCEVNKEYPNDEILSQVNNFISYTRNSNINLDSPEGDEILKNTQELFENPLQIYNKYMDLKKKNNWIDFDDMICIANNILSTNHFISKKYKELYQFIQVDEAQDINPIQYEIIKKLSKHSGNLCQVADDDQCIYSWRGSDPSIILNIKEEFPQTQIIYMERNFRSAPIIVEHCNEFIKNNKKRYKKNMYTENDFEGKIEVTGYKTILNQANSIIQKILESSKNYSDNAILYRNNSSALPIVLECIKQNLPFNITVKENSILKQFILDDIMSFYAFANNTSDKNAFFNFIYKIKLIYMKKTELKKALDELNGDVLDWLNTLGLKSSILSKFKLKILALRNSKSATGFLRILLEELNYKEHILKKADESTIDMLYALSENENNIENVIIKISELLDNISNKEYEENGVNLMTLHTSKGLEWKNVYLIDFNEKIIPNEKSDEEEERRLAYIGYSRSIQNLNISFYLKSEQEQEPSHFIEEFVPNFREVEFEVNKKVFHKRFGVGKIIEKNEGNIIIDFNQEGIKKINLKVALNRNLIRAV